MSLKRNQSSRCRIACVLHCCKAGTIGGRHVLGDVGKGGVEGLLCLLAHTGQAGEFQRFRVGPVTQLDLDLGQTLQIVMLWAPSVINSDVGKAANSRHGRHCFFELLVGEVVQ